MVGGESLHVGFKYGGEGWGFTNNLLFMIQMFEVTLSMNTVMQVKSERE